MTSNTMFFPLLLLALLVVLLFLLAIIMAFRFKQRELQHRERMAAIEKGAALPVLENPWRPTSLLLRGMMWLFSGFGLVLFLLAISLAGPKDITAADRVQKANWAKNAGATEDQVREIMSERQQPGLPAGFSLIGLIPIGVGLAYLITYRKESTLKTAS